VAEARDLTLVEGSGGFLVPIDEKRDFADLALRLEASLAVVVRPGLGTLNHTALTLEAAERRGLKVPLLVCSGASPGSRGSTGTTRPGSNLSAGRSWMRCRPPISP